ncbi:MAG TPA: AAA family ATPase [Archangium sp.]|uniref:AAA family ATPase n=1 Tax=Archangium sp. TaxID=1872627 RepID=UPI002E327F6C|nr:AAA family ATPase [Archangium sp.]HEX5752518.1 AAA family ATPase [Archangium sp.]
MSPSDLRLAAFLSDRTEVFHSIQHRHEIWRPDPFDVERVHQDARASFERLLTRATTPPGLSSGRILLLLGESGCGKTHLVRAFRARVHEHSLGFVGYLQMTTSTSNYGRYVLSNLIESLDQPYFEPSQPGSGLMKLSSALFARCGKWAASLSQTETDADDVHQIVSDAADELIDQPELKELDLDLLRALLYLQRSESRIKNRVLKYLRCEDLSEPDRKVLGGMVPRIHDEDPKKMVEHLGRLMRALGHSLVICVDQLEDMYDQHNAGEPFRRAVQTLCDLADRVPSSLVVISCLKDFWTKLSPMLTRPMLDRLTLDPAPIHLHSLRTAEEARLIAEKRLEYLYDQENAPFEAAEPTYPLPHEGFEALAGLRARDVLNHCRRYRELSVHLGRLPEHFPLVEELTKPGSPESTPESTSVSELDPLWNDFRTGYKGSTPDDDSELAVLLTWALSTSTDEWDGGHRFEARTLDESIQVDVSPGNTKLQVVLCNSKPNGGALAREIEQARKEAKGRTPVVVRTTVFPSNPKTQAAEELGKLIAKGGRRAVLEDSDCRTLLALRDFRAQHESRADFAAWLRSARPLTQVKALRDILDLEHLRPVARTPPAAAQAPATEKPGTPQQPLALRTDPKPQEASPQPSRQHEASQEPPRRQEPMRIGELESLSRDTVTLTPQELIQHAAFLGGSGSGKTTLALNVVEQLLLQGIPAILVDRKGDLAGYAQDASHPTWTRPLDDPRRSDRRALLRDRLDVALFTPGHPHGRPLAIPIVPDGLGSLSEFDRKQATQLAGDALGGMLDYRHSGRDKACRTVLTQAIDQLVQLSPAGVTLEKLVYFIDEKDPRLVNAVGRLETKLFEKLVQDLETLRLSSSALLGSGGEKLDMELLLGRGAHARPGKTRLSVISTKFLGDTDKVLFWVSQLLIEVSRWLGHHPSTALQAVLMFDEADMYLPATRQPATKQPMENLLRRARSAGLGVMLATQSPGDFDYKCRDTIRSWFVGRVKEKNSLDKMKPMLSEARVDFTAKIPNQVTGQFHVLREGNVQPMKADPSVLATEQLPDDELLRLAASTLPPADPRRTGS